MGIIDPSVWKRYKGSQGTKLFFYTKDSSTGSGYIGLQATHTSKGLDSLLVDSQEFQSAYGKAVSLNGSASEAYLAKNLALAILTNVHHALQSAQHERRGHAAFLPIRIFRRG